MFFKELNNPLYIKGLGVGKFLAEGSIKVYLKVFPRQGWVQGVEASKGGTVGEMYTGVNSSSPSPTIDFFKIFYLVLFPV